MCSILWISPYVPYDSVDHAGGKNHNYYVKYFSKKHDYDITLITLAHERQLSKIDLDEYGIKNRIGVIKNDRWHTLLRYFCNIESEYNPFNRYCGVFSNYQRWLLQKQIKDYFNEGTSPDIIILQWTQTVLLMDEIKNFFPNSKIVAIEEDVVFLAYERKMLYAKTFFQRKVWEYKYRKIKKIEIDALKKTELIVVNNKKDKRLLISEGLPEDLVCQGPIYYDDYSDVKRNIKNNNVIFYGAMRRKENSLSALWFVNEVMPLLEDTDIKFLIIGGGADKLKKIHQNNVEVLGYVADLKPYFSESLCLVAPLVLGAGIKVKILEAFSAGIPVITNHIGIEGIDAIDGKDYFHCEKAEEYAAKIKELLKNHSVLDTISDSARLYLREEFPLDIALENLIDMMHKM